MQKTRPPQGAQAALRAIRLLKLFTEDRPELSLAELSKASGLNKTTTHRLLRALQSESLVERNAGTSQYSLGPGLMALGVQALASSDLRRRVRPMLRSLSNETGEIATLEVPVEASMLVLDEVAGRNVIGTIANVGTLWPMHATSTGKAYMAFDDDGASRLSQRLMAVTPKTVVDRAAISPQLIEIRKRGYAVTVDELVDGYTEIATVIRGTMGEVQGAIAIGGPTQRLTARRCVQLGASLCNAAARLSPDY